MAERLEFFTPCVGRFVNGSITEKRTKDHQNRTKPEDKQQFEFGVAFPKADIWPMLAEQFHPYLMSALASDQNALNRAQNWFSTMSGFSMKIADGDAPNAKGQKNENTAGCFVFYFSGNYAPVTVDPANLEIPADAIKRGFYVQIAGNIVPNGLQGDHAGVYMNANFMRLCGEGDEIRGGGDPNEAFGGTTAPPSLPAGARPVGSTSGAAGAFTPPAQGGTQTGPAGMPGMPGQGQPAVAPTTASLGNTPQTQPDTGFLSGPPKLPGT